MVVSGDQKQPPNATLLRGSIRNLTILNVFVGTLDPHAGFESLGGANKPPSFAVVPAILPSVHVSLQTVRESVSCCTPFQNE